MRKLKRASDVDVRDLDAERSQRDDAAQSSNKRPAEVPVEEIDSERREEARLGLLKAEVGGRPPAEAGSLLSLHSLNTFYADDGTDYDEESLHEVLAALTKFGDLPTVSEMYSPPRVAAQAMTINRAQARLQHRHWNI